MATTLHEDAQAGYGFPRLADETWRTEKVGEAGSSLEGSSIGDARLWWSDTAEVTKKNGPRVHRVAVHLMVWRASRWFLLGRNLVR